MDVVIDRELDLEDLYTTPDDGNRYEILDGALVMTPPPNTAHQNVSAELHAILRNAVHGCGMKVLAAPYAWRIGPGQVPEPDLVVAPVVEPDEPGLTVLRLDGTEYVDDARAIGSEPYQADDPFPARVVPAALIV